MGAPSVNIAFLEKAVTAIQRGERGIIAMLLKEADAAETDFTVLSVADIPEWLTEFNKQQLKAALLGYQNAPKKIIVHIIAAPDGYNDALVYFAKQKWNYLVIPTVETDKKTDDVASWIKTQRTQNHMTYKAVLPNCAADQEGVVNVVTGYSWLPSGSSEAVVFTPEQACARVAGIICGTPLTMSCTYAPLNEAEDCDRLEKEDLDKAVDSGRFAFMWDGEKVKVCRGVTSFVTTGDSKGDSFKKIKLVDAMDMIRDDITTTAQDSYIGKYVNSYDNKCLLITAVNAYFSQLVQDGVLASGKVEIDLDAHRNYFKGKGGRFIVDGEEINVEDATDQQIKEGNTGSYVFLAAYVSLLDAIEDIQIDIYIG